MGTWTLARVSLTVPWAETDFDQTGNRISVRLATSRTPASMIKAPYASRHQGGGEEIAEISVLAGDVGPTTRMSPACACSMATWIIQLSPGATSHVRAFPAIFTGL